jgi:hypothetical protein
MSKEIVKIAPEELEIANSYIMFGNISAVSQQLAIPEHKVCEMLDVPAIKRYIDNIYLDKGYRNKNNIASLMDDMIASKLEEAQESGIYSSKDLADLLQMAHKMRMDELTAENKRTEGIKNQTNVQINEALPFGQGNYGKLMEKLLKDVN